VTNYKPSGFAFSKLQILGFLDHTPPDSTFENEISLSVCVIVRLFTKTQVAITLNYLSATQEARG
jgi:hypothetical protein